VSETEVAGAREAALAESLMFGALGLAALFSISLFFFTSIGMARPLVRISRAMTDLANNKAEVSIPYAKRRDEIGDLARTAHTFHSAQQAQIIRDKEQRQREEETARASRSEALRGLATMFEQRVSDVIARVGIATERLGGLATQLNDGAKQADQRSAELVDATERSAAGVDAVQGASEQLSSAVNEISQQVEGSRGLSNNAVSEVERASHVVDGLANAARKIGDVVGLINDITPPNQPARAQCHD